MVEEGNERIQCIEVNQISNKPILIICVYMPTSGGSEKTIEYPETVDLLNELLQRYYNNIGHCVFLLFGIIGIDTASALEVI
jgi:hypothetical protein